MTLQNRVTPLGEIVVTPARGLLMGNRGIIHDPETRALLRRRWTTRAWICCVCDYRGVRRVPMSRPSWTELFFLDEATALAAGHRPCFLCRREAALAFRAAWAAGRGGAPPSAAAMDAILHRERLDGRAKRLHPLPAPPEALPDGAMLASGGDVFLVLGGRALRWTTDSYAEPRESLNRPVLLTPPSTLGALFAGYRPLIHPSAARA